MGLKFIRTNDREEIRCIHVNNGEKGLVSISSSIVADLKLTVESRIGFAQDDKNSKKLYMIVNPPDGIDSFKLGRPSKSKSLRLSSVGFSRLVFDTFGTKDSSIKFLVAANATKIDGYEVYPLIYHG